MPHSHLPTVTTIPDAPTRWAAMWAVLGAAAPPPGALDTVLGHWREPQRRYHTLEHLLECLTAFDEIASLATHPAEVELAIWCHDAIHEIGVDTNELKSAYLAERWMTTAGCDRDAIGRVRNLILATRHHGQPETTDEALLLDIDLAILGSAPARFDRYDADIREEYHAVPWSKYVAGRRRLLRTFLERPRLYFTGHFHDRLDGPARANLSRVLKRLRPLQGPGG
jgi:predicted metal-dependent HD superfamily phosphohydrolase